MILKKDTFCVAPWYSIFLGPDKKLAPCCKIRRNTYTHNYNEIKEYFDSNQLTDLRNDLLNGVKNKNCNSCWHAEKKNIDSLRLISNRTLMGKLPKGSLQQQIETPKVENINSFDLVLGNLCNLKCVMCTPNLSSQLMAEVDLNPQLKKRYTDKKILNQSFLNWPKTDDFVEWCNKVLPQSIHIKFSGGEPFVIPWIYDVIEKIPDEQKAKCILHFTTNLTIINHKLIECFKKFKEVWLSVSSEGSHNTFEYLRYGHKWEKLVENIKLIQDKKIKNLMLMVNHVVQAPSYHSILPMVDFFDSLELKINPILLTTPAHFHISSLTKETKSKFLEKTENYAGFNKKFIDYLRNISLEHIDQNESLAKECIKHLEEFDMVRKNDWKKIIPVENLLRV